MSAQVTARTAEAKLHAPQRLLDGRIVWPYHRSMATTTIKTTYALDEQTVRALEAMARQWRVSKSEALRRAIRSAAATELGEASSAALAALDELQTRLGLSEEQARQWAEGARQERRASSSRR